MSWNLEESISYYETQGAPQNQTALINLLREIQQESGGGIPAYALGLIAGNYGVKETFLQAIIRRIPSLRLDSTHCLELCGGPNCGRHKELADCAKKLHAASGGRFTLKFVPCMRMCGKGPNIRWDGVLYHQGTEELLKKLVEEANR